MVALLRNLPGVYTPERLEMYYHQVGWHKGRFATPMARKTVRIFWIGAGGEGAHWLVGRIATETHGEILEGVANLLADIGPSSIGPIADALDANFGRDRSEFLLKALGWIGAERDVPIVEPRRLEGIIGRYLSDTDPDIRESACAATAVLGRSHRV